MFFDCGVSSPDFTFCKKHRCTVRHCFEPITVSADAGAGGEFHRGPTSGPFVIQSAFCRRHSCQVYCCDNFPCFAVVENGKSACLKHN